MTSMKQSWMKRMAAPSDITSPGFIFLVVILAIVLAAPAVLAQDIGEIQAFVPVRSAYGVSIGTPGLINLNTDQFFSEKIGLRFAAGYVKTDEDGHMAGLQVGPIMKLREKLHSCTSLGVALGYSEVDNPGMLGWWDGTWTYGALTFGYRYHNLFMETGLSVGDGDGSSPQFLIHGGFNFKTVRRAP